MPECARDRFGEGLAAGDLTGDGVDDLAVGGSELTGDPELGESQADACPTFGGAVTVLAGSASGLRLAPPVITGSTAGIPGGAEVDDGFGRSVAILTRTSAGPGWLAVGADGDDHSGSWQAGRVVVVPASSTGLEPASSVEWHQGVNGIAGEPASNEHFGWLVGRAE